MRLSLAVAALVAGALLPSLAEGQKRCVKGIPCGNTCISASKTCRIGSGTATRGEPTPRETARPRPAREVAPQRATSGPIILPADTTGFVAVAGGTVYYRAACQAAREIPERYVVRFETEAAAQRVGMTRSKVPDC